MLLITFVWHARKARSEGRLLACLSNLQSLQAALEHYRSDNGGEYPGRLALLTPKYLKLIPTCPSHPSPDPDGDPYSAKYIVSSSPPAFTVRCAGSRHAGIYIRPDYPCCSSRDGLQKGELGTPTPIRIFYWVIGRGPERPDDND